MCNQLNKVKLKRNNKKDKLMRTLFDTGSSSFVINRKCIKEHPFLKKNKPEKLITKSGKFITDGQAITSFTLDECDPHRVINWTVHAYEADHNEDDQFDMIIGKNSMHKLVIKIDQHMNSIT